MADLFSRFFSNITNKNLIKNGDHVVCAFSGGKDSTALLDMLIRLKKHINIELSAAYMNHKIRKDAKEEELHVKEHCLSRGVKLTIEEEDVPDFSKKSGMNLEAAASLKRYQFLESALESGIADLIATAHTMSDISETFLMKLMRGSGTTGLASIYEKKEPGIIRPMLIFTSEEVNTYLKEKGIKCYEDPSNEDTKYLRNRVRHEVLPLIRKIDKKIDNHIYATANILERETDYFKKISNNILKKNIILGKILKTDIIKKEHPAIGFHLIREYIRKLNGNLYNITLEHLTLFMKMVWEERSFSIPGQDIKIRNGFIFPKNMVINNYKHICEGSSGIIIDEIGKKAAISTELEFKKPPDNFSALIPLNKIIFPLVIKNPEADMNYRKMNAKFSQPAREVISNSGVPFELMNLSAAVINGNGEVIWISGCPVTEKYKYDSQVNKENKFLRIKFDDI